MARKPTAFEQRVYDAISRIPLGRVSTYALIGKAIGCKSAQAIGQALKRNPSAPQVPCHRVISSSLTIGGFFGNHSGTEIARKIKMLAAEGVKFADGKLVDSQRVHRFE